MKVFRELLAMFPIASFPNFLMCGFLISHSYFLVTPSYYFIKYQGNVKISYMYRNGMFLLRARNAAFHSVQTINFLSPLDISAIDAVCVNAHYWKLQSKLLSTCSYTLENNTVISKEKKTFQLSTKF